MKRRGNKGQREGDRDEEDEQGEVVDDLAYESLSMERIHAGGYVWDAQNEAYRKAAVDAAAISTTTNATTIVEDHFLEEGNLPSVRSISASASAAFELDREKLRQWDLLSSACLLQEQQQQQQQRSSMADSGRGLPIVERPGDVLAVNAFSLTNHDRGVVLKALECKGMQATTSTSAITSDRQQLNETKEACNRAAGEWLLKASGGVFRK